MTEVMNLVRSPKKRESVVRLKKPTEEGLETPRTMNFDLRRSAREKKKGP